MRTERRGRLSGVRNAGVGGAGGAGVVRLLTVIQGLFYPGKDLQYGGKQDVGMEDQEETEPEYYLK